MKKTPKALNKLSKSKVAEIFKGLPLGGKIFAGVAGLLVTSNLLRSGISSAYNSIYYPTMHSGKENTFSYLSNNSMTDFGSRWKGLSKNILKLCDAKNTGLSDIMKTTMTPFTNKNGVYLGKTMIRMNPVRRRSKFVNIRNITENPTLELSKVSNIGHIVQ